MAASCLLFSEVQVLDGATHQHATRKYLLDYWLCCKPTRDKFMTTHFTVNWFFGFSVFRLFGCSSRRQYNFHRSSGNWQFNRSNCGLTIRFSAELQLLWSLNVSKDDRSRPIITKKMIRMQSHRSLSHVMLWSLSSWWKILSFYDGHHGVDLHRADEASVVRKSRPCIDCSIDHCCLARQ